MMAPFRFSGSVLVVGEFSSVQFRVSVGDLDIDE